MVEKNEHQEPCCFIEKIYRKWRHANENRIIGAGPRGLSVAERILHNNQDRHSS